MSILDLNLFFKNFFSSKMVLDIDMRALGMVFRVFTKGYGTLGT
jgi:hypothetical protein